jgi:hypothetical protein
MCKVPPITGVPLLFRFSVSRLEAGVLLVVAGLLAATVLGAALALVDVAADPLAVALGVLDLLVQAVSASDATAATANHRLTRPTFHMNCLLGTRSRRGGSVSGARHAL